MILELSHCHLCIAISHLRLVFHSPTIISSIVLIPRLCCVTLSPHTEFYPIFCLFLGQTGSHLSFGVTATCGWAETMSLRTYLHELVFFSDFFFFFFEAMDLKFFFFFYFSSHLFIYLFLFFQFYFISKLYIFVLVLPNIKINPPQV